jgi:hypothetical protein
MSSLKLFKARRITLRFLKCNRFLFHFTFSSSARSREIQKCRHRCPTPFFQNKILNRIPIRLSFRKCRQLPLCSMSLRLVYRSHQLILFAPFVFESRARTLTPLRWQFGDGQTGTNPTLPYSENRAMRRLRFTNISDLKLSRRKVLS